MQKRGLVFTGSTKISIHYLVGDKKTGCLQENVLVNGDIFKRVYFAMAR